MKLPSQLQVYRPVVLAVAAVLLLSSPSLVVTAFTATTTATIARIPLGYDNPQQQQRQTRRGHGARRIAPQRLPPPPLRMGWGPEPVWTAATVVAVADACPSGKSVRVRLAVTDATAAAYTQPGQYVQVRPAPRSGGGSSSSGSDEAKPNFLAMCSAPPPPQTPNVGDDNNNENDDENAAPSAPSLSSSFEFLIKRTANLNWLTESAAGTTAVLQVSQVLGNGYAIAENMDGLKYDFPTQNVLLFAAGSGIAPVAAVIESGALRLRPPPSAAAAGTGDRIAAHHRTCRLYYGEQTATDLCFVERFAAWEDLGVEVVPVLSQPPEAIHRGSDSSDGSGSDGDTAWRGRAGYLQTALAEDGIAVPRNTAALLCGMKGMTEACQELLLAAGVFAGRILYNF